MSNTVVLCCSQFQTWGEVAIFCGLRLHSWLSVFANVAFCLHLLVHLSRQIVLVLTHASNYMLPKCDLICNLPCIPSLLPMQVTICYLNVYMLPKCDLIYNLPCIQSFLPIQVTICYLNVT